MPVVVPVDTEAALGCRDLPSDKRLVGVDIRAAGREELLTGAVSELLPERSVNLPGARLKHRAAT